MPLRLPLGGPVFPFPAAPPRTLTHTNHRAAVENHRHDLGLLQLRLDGQLVLHQLFDALDAAAAVHLVFRALDALHHILPLEPRAGRDAVVDRGEVPLDAAPVAVL